MFTYDRTQYTGKVHAECLSTDTKPTNLTNTNIHIGNGSDCIEMDTGDVYLYDKANNVWRKL